MVIKSKIVTFTTFRHTVWSESSREHHSLQYIVLTMAKLYSQLRSNCSQVIPDYKSVSQTMGIRETF